MLAGSRHVVLPLLHSILGKADCYGLLGYPLFNELDQLLPRFDDIPHDHGVFHATQFTPANSSTPQVRQGPVPATSSDMGPVMVHWKRTEDMETGFWLIWDFKKQYPTTTAHWTADMGLCLIAVTWAWPFLVLQMVASLALGGSWHSFRFEFVCNFLVTGFSMIASQATSRSFHDRCGDFGHGPSTAAHSMEIVDFSLYFPGTWCNTP